MPRNGSGTYTRSNSTYTGATVWQQDFAGGNKIVDSRHDLHDQDIADAITASLAKDGQTTPTANLPMGGFKHTNVAVASARTDYARASQVQDSTLQWCGTSGGAADAQTLTPSPSITAYTAGQRFAFVAGFTNTGATTINVSGLGAKNVILGTGTALPAGAITANTICEIIYGGSDFVLINGNTSILLGNLLYSGSRNVFATTSDGSDSAGIGIWGGGSNSATRGAGSEFYGNESSFNAGGATIRTGNISNAVLALVNSSSNGSISANTNSADRWFFESDGDLSNDATNGGNLVFAKTGTGVIHNVNNAVSTAGSDQAGATALTATINLITTASGTQGVRLPSPVAGQTIIVANNSGVSTARIYPHSGGNIDGGTSNVHILISTATTFTFVAMSSTMWWRTSIQ